MTRNEDLFIQLYFDRRRNKPTLRAMPETAREPTPGQVEVRKRFGEVARATKGIRDIEERHRIIANEMRGFRSYRAKPRKRFELAPGVLALLERMGR